MANIVIYTTEVCPYCQRAKQLLKTKGAEYTEIRVDQDATQKEQMISRSGRRSVPQIFINDLHIGGFDDLAALEQQGKLAILLSQA